MQPQATRFLKFAGKVTLAHVVTYFVMGAAAYHLLTKQLYIGDQAPLETFMRTEADPILWKHVVTWFVPGQILRGILMAAVLFPFLDTFLKWNFPKRFLSIAGIYLVFAFWGAAGAVVGNIEGLIYLRPEFTLQMHLRVQPEILLQGLALGAWIAWWIPERRRGS